MSEYDGKDLAYSELLKEADESASNLSDAATEIIRLNEEVEQLKFEAEIMKDCIGNMFELNSGDYDCSKKDMDDAINFWVQAFETAGITTTILQSW